MLPERIAELLKPYLAPCHTKSSPPECHSEPSRRLDEEPAVLSSVHLNAISTYIDLLLRWNARVNLTAIRNEEEIVTRHFGESIFAARQLFPAHKKNQESAAGNSLQIRLADFGSGAGFPGIPIKIWSPEISLTLIEASHKKAAFLREAARALTLTDIDIQNARAETLTQTFDVVSLRAVERLLQVLPIACRLTAPNGRLALLISSSIADQARTTLPGLSWQVPVPIPDSKSRLLLIGNQSS